MNVHREERDSAQRAKFIFSSVAGVVILLLLASFVIASRARSGRESALRELELCRQDNATLAQHLDGYLKETDRLKKQLAAAPARPKPAAKGKPAPRTAPMTKKKTTRTR